ncbi:MAG: hypothetical protein ACLFTK_16285 [Anaerolineales bacterium]
MMNDFTPRHYAALCAVVATYGGEILLQSEIMQHGATVARFVGLRHDVDSQPARALALARIEAAHGLRATYYFRTVPGPFNPAIIRAVAALGHEIGYHYEVLAQTRGDVSAARALFARELARLRALAPVQVASMHGSPLHPWDNRGLWAQAAPADYDLIGEAYRDIDYARVAYLNDTGRTWHPTRYNLRDHTGTAPDFAPERTADIIVALRAGTAPPRLILSTHPERWQASPVAWWRQRARDVAGNSVKLVLRRVYRSR